MTSLFRRPFYLLLAMFSLFGCFRKKESTPKNIEAWIEAKFPQQLVVVQSNWNFDVVDLLFSGKKIAVLADKSDPDVQFTMPWVKGSKESPGLGLDSAQVQARLDTCRADVQRARELFTLLKNNGLQQFSVGSIEQSAYILVFAEPGPDTRRQAVSIVKATLDARQEQPQTSIWMEIMEPAFYHTEFKDIVPHAFWQRPGTLHRDKKIMSLDFEWKKGIPLDALVRGWELNTASDRCSSYQASAYRQALAWAEKNLPQPFYLEPEQMIRFDLGTDSRDPASKSGIPFIRFGFPFYKSKPVEPAAGQEPEVEPDGFVTGIYQIDEQTFIRIRQVKEM